MSNVIRTTKNVRRTTLAVCLATVMLLFGLTPVADATIAAGYNGSCCTILPHAACCESGAADGSDCVDQACGPDSTGAGRNLPTPDRGRTGHLCGKRDCTCRKRKSPGNSRKPTSIDRHSDHTAN
ncbi:hypothetical protein COY93_01375 [Candidatus Uhrbacteria bacterium CG_4_10_14_0_8_um_filter_58_22]|uniref:Uncharacterized protein n=1 Tax=Candidatus Uhrbacteria bacterium CG_4_10_14_0_8_um_filter_58_22 TaxID=1975029 RepID=A0A2M7QAL8_9BACT|nr:MAG: hypothetical protein AUJ19_03805 [Parcubacteria group bacterium CG1_02_58_44]PIY63161.1 MAG: hypothetical protein COY93_01375 [Candidatus Uhrbacteria bacterium CG_4_10_14_0_8_um_filter_58_22]